MSASLIVGCGYLGRVLAARLVARGEAVYGTTRSLDKAAELAAMRVRPLLLAVTQPVTHASLTPALEAEALDVYYMVPPGRGAADGPTPRQVILGGIAHMVKTLRRASVRRAVLVSSTAVYGNVAGQRVDADTPPAPTDARARLLLEGEKLWLAAGDAYHVLRLSGLYGPGRVIGLQAVRDGAPLVGDPQALLNLIHVDDAAALCDAIAHAPASGRIEVGSDGNPIPRVEYYAHVARLLGVPAPVVLDPAEAQRQLGLDAARLRRTPSKAVDNIATCRRTGWAPQYPTFRAGLDAIFAAHAEAATR